MDPSFIFAARRALSKIDPALAKAHRALPVFERWAKEPGFPGLVSLIVEQQVSIASARAVLARLSARLGGIGVEQILANDIEALRSCGLSSQKARYLQGLAEAHATGRIDLEAVRAMDDQTACQALLELVGVGRWTAEAYLMGCEARTDIFPAGDMALQEAIRILDGNSRRPSVPELYERSERWRPFRSVAANLLWAYYTGVKRGEIKLPRGVPRSPSATAVVSERAAESKRHRKLEPKSARTAQSKRVAPKSNAKGVRSRALPRSSAKQEV